MVLSLIRSLPVLAMMLMFASFPVLAEDKEDAASSKPSVQQKLDEFTQGFNEHERSHFLSIYSSYNLISVVEIVREDVETAIEKCADVNPDMEDALEERYEAWDDAIEPIMEEAESSLDNMIKVQDYASRGDIEDFFDLVEMYREEKTQDIDKMPVTTPEACEHLRSKMDETQENLTKLLRSTLVSLPPELPIEEKAEDTPEEE